MDIKIRKGNTGDVQSLLSLIRELALNEKALEQVEVTEEEWLRDGFGQHPLYHFFVAELDGKIEGIALYYFKYSTWKGKAVFLEDIVVNEKSRRYGLGSKLFHEVVKVAANEKCRRMDWQVLDWNEPAIKFYKKYEALLDDEWLDGRLFEKDIHRIVASINDGSIK
jgi:GNAT superfamily N-acetyltransferase